MGVFFLNRVYIIERKSRSVWPLEFICGVNLQLCLVFVLSEHWEDKSWIKADCDGRDTAWCVQDGSSINRRDNPHKYLLYKPTISQLFTFLASGFKELPPTGVMLLYLSADGCLGNAKHSDDSKSPTHSHFIYLFCFLISKTIQYVLSGTLNCEWWLCVVVSTLALITVVNQHSAQLLLQWVTVYEQINRLGM